MERRAENIGVGIPGPGVADALEPARRCRLECIKHRASLASKQ
jgi:hypothetical protein